MALDMNQLLDETMAVASLPDVVMRVQTILNDPQHSLDHIARIVTEDPGLSARVLKIANSSLYSFPFPICTVTRALTLIGTNSLQDLITATVVMEMFRGVPEDLVRMDDYWRHSIACGVAARVLAIARREVNIERYYLTGLLHDVGLLVLYTQRPELAARILQRCRKESLPLPVLERGELGFDHAELGGELLRRWNLPPEIYLPVRCHHHPLPCDDFPMETATVHVADIIAAALMLGTNGDGHVPVLESDAWRRMGLPASAVHPLLDHVHAQYADAVDIFLEGHRP